MPTEVKEFMRSARLVDVRPSENMEQIAAQNSENEKDGTPLIVERIAKEIPDAGKYSFSYLTAELDASGRLLIFYGSPRCDGDCEIKLNKALPPQLAALKKHLVKDFGADFIEPEEDVDVDI